LPVQIMNIVNRGKRFFIILVACWSFQPSANASQYCVGAVAGNISLALIVNYWVKGTPLVRGLIYTTQLLGVVGACMLTPAHAAEVVSDPIRAYRERPEVRNMVDRLGSENAYKVYEMKAGGTPDEEIARFIESSLILHESSKNQI
jgi:hypothetical protein